MGLIPAENRYRRGVGIGFVSRIFTVSRTAAKKAISDMVVEKQRILRLFGCPAIR